MNYKELNGKTIREGFKDFHKENPHIYKAFEEQCMTALGVGKTKLSAKLIINWIRWNQFLITKDKSFKINDAYQAYYSRLFVVNHPEHKNVFDFRKLRNEEQGPFMQVDKTGQISFL